MTETVGWRRRPRRLAPLLLVVPLLVAGLGASSAGADVTVLNGSAYGAFVKVSLFGGPANQVGAAPVVVLPASGQRQSASHPGVVAQFGPATIFGGHYVENERNPSGKLTVTTEGRTGAGGFVTSSATVGETGPGPLISDGMSSTCRADEKGVTGSVTIENGVVETSYDVDTQEPATTAPIPHEPAPNTVIEGEITHVGDRFRIVFNEQVVKGDTIVVRAAHMYLLGDIAVGDLIVGQSVCGLSADDGSTAPPTTVGSGGQTPAATEDTAMSEPPTTETATTEKGADERLDTEAAAKKRAADDDSGSAAPVVVGAAVVVAGGLAAAVALRRRRRPADDT